jgi:hypothetical protein
MTSKAMPPEVSPLNRTPAPPIPRMNAAIAKIRLDSQPKNFIAAPKIENTTINGIAKILSVIFIVKSPFLIGFYTYIIPRPGAYEKVVEPTEILSCGHFGTNCPEVAPEVEFTN